MTDEEKTKEQERLGAVMNTHAVSTLAVLTSRQERLMSIEDPGDQDFAEMIGNFAGAIAYVELMRGVLAPQLHVAAETIAKKLAEEVSR